MKALDAEMRDLLRFTAERAILPRYQALAASEVEEKSAGDPVTIADREAEAFLREALAQLAGEVGFVGEEAAHNDPAILEQLSGPCWIVDPLDGTRNFAAGKPPFAIMVALADGGEAVAGWIYDPLTGRLCHAQLGQGAFIDGEAVTAQPTGNQPPIAAISTIFASEERREALEREIMPYYECVPIPLCAGEQYPRLALGQNDVSLFERTLAWDHAAGVLWLNEAGGKAARPDGSPYRVDEIERTGLIGAASPALWEEIASSAQSL